MEQTYGQFLGWLRRNGDLDPEGDPVSQTTPDFVARFISERRTSVSDSNTYNNVRTLTLMMNCLAPDRDWTWIWRQGGAPRRGEARAARRRPHLCPPGLLMHRLVVALQEALAAPGGPASAMRFRDHLFVAIAVCTALRSRNLREMRLGHNLIWRKTGWEIIYDASEVKNGEVILGRLPRVLNPFVERYVEVERLRLAKGRGGAMDKVWVSARGGPLSPVSVGLIFHRVAVQMLGYPIHPHSTRYMAATRILEDDARALKTASLALAHKEQRTVSEFYDYSRGARAAQVIWLSLRDRTSGGKLGNDPA
jgi:integrase